MTVVPYEAYSEGLMLCGQNAVLSILLATENNGLHHHFPLQMTDCQ